MQQAQAQEAEEDRSDYLILVQIDTLAVHQMVQVALVEMHMVMP
jgi:hypothetical protein